MKIIVEFFIVVRLLRDPVAKSFEVYQAVSLHEPQQLSNEMTGFREFCRNIFLKYKLKDLCARVFNLHFHY